MWVLRPLRWGIRVPVSPQPPKAGRPTPRALASTAGRLPPVLVDSVLVAWRSVPVSWRVGVTSLPSKPPSLSELGRAGGRQTWNPTSPASGHLGLQACHGGLTEAAASGSVNPSPGHPGSWQPPESVWLWGAARVAACLSTQTGACHPESLDSEHGPGPPSPDLPIQVHCPLKAQVLGSPYPTPLNLSATRLRPSA